MQGYRIQFDLGVSLKQDQPFILSGEIIGEVPFEPRQGSVMSVSWYDKELRFDTIELEMGQVTWDASDREFVGSFKSIFLDLDEDESGIEEYRRNFLLALEKAGFKFEQIVKNL